MSVLDWFRKSPRRMTRGEALQELQRIGAITRLATRQLESDLPSDFESTVWLISSAADRLVREFDPYRGCCCECPESRAGQAAGETKEP